jgi:two-component system cell cycle response regulator
MARVLVIEDNPANLELMSYLLQAFGHTVLTATDGVAGIETVRRDAPDLIVCDIQLPGIDGFEVARRLKIDPKLRTIPLVAVTALAMVGDRDKVLAAGFDGYIAKPIAPETFIGQVEVFIGPGTRAAASETAAVTASASNSTDTPTATGKRTAILSVDDSPVNLSLIRSTLEPFGYQVTTAKSATEALELARKTRPDLILSDVHMPKESGYDFVQAIKADPQLRRVPFVFLSSTVMSKQDEKTGLALGADKFILRPVDPDVLAAEIEDCLATRAET